MKDDYSKGQMLGIGIAALILPNAAVGARLWAKQLGQKGIRIDDYLILVALAIAIACCVTQLVAATSGRLGQHQKTDQDNQPILNDPSFIIYEKCKFASQILATVGLGVVKASILFFYLSIFVVKGFKICAFTMLTIVTAWTLAFFFSNLFTCYPVTPFVEAFYGHKCIDAVPMWYASCISDFILDFMILLMPIPMVLRLKLPLQQRLMVMGMFMLGAVVCAISVTRFAVYLHVGRGFLRHYNDETYYTSPVFFWTNIEIALSVVSACLPTYRPIWLHFKGTSGEPARESYRMSSYRKFSGNSGTTERAGEDMTSKDEEWAALPDRTLINLGLPVERIR